MIFKNYKEIISNGNDKKIKKIRSEVLEILNYGIKSVDPYNSIKNFLSENKIDITDFNNIYLIAFGKASIGMAEAISDSFNIFKGIVVTNEKNKKLNNKKIKIINANHPIPDENSINAADEIINLLKSTKKDDLIFVLISGGGSALLCKPKISLSDLQKTTDILLKSGADIKEINTIRKHLSFVKGGQLIKYTKSKIISLIISDIINDPMDYIASGPTCPDSTSYQDSKNIFNKYNLIEKIPISVLNILEAGINNKIAETAKKDDAIFDNVSNFIIANNRLFCNSAIKKAEKLGFKTMLLTNSLDGEAKDVSNFLIDKTISYKTYAEKILFISGGETTVTIKGKGKGGRNQEMVLSSVEKIKDYNIVFCSFATDGIDGNSDAAGAIADKYSNKRAIKQNLNSNIFLEKNDSYNFFLKLKDLLLTGPSGTNVMDIQIVVKYK